MRIAKDQKASKSCANCKERFVCRVAVRKKEQGIPLENRVCTVWRSEKRKRTVKPVQRMEDMDE